MRRRALTEHARDLLNLFLSKSQEKGEKLEKKAGAGGGLMWEVLRASLMMKRRSERPERGAAHTAKPRAEKYNNQAMLEIKWWSWFSIFYIGIFFVILTEYPLSVQLFLNVLMTLRKVFMQKQVKKKKDDVNKMTFIYTVPVCYFLQNTSMILTQIHSLNDWMMMKSFQKGHGRMLDEESSLSTPENCFLFFSLFFK